MPSGLQRLKSLKRNCASLGERSGQLALVGRIVQPLDVIRSQGDCENDAAVRILSKACSCVRRAQLRVQPQVGHGAIPVLAAAGLFLGPVLYAALGGALYVLECFRQQRVRNAIEASPLPFSRLECSMPCLKLD